MLKDTEQLVDGCLRTFLST